MHLSLLSSSPCFSSVSLVVAIVMSSTCAQLSSSVVNWNPCFLISSSNSVSATRKGKSKGNWRLACALQKPVPHRDRPAASLCVRPSCWLYIFLSRPYVGEDLSQNRTPTSCSFDGATPSRSANPVLAVTCNEDCCWFGSHFRVDLPSNLRCSTFVVDSALV